MKEATVQSMGSSKHAEWCTPEEVLEPVYELGDIALDPCSNLCSVVKSKKAVRLPQDGLTLCWNTEVAKVGGGTIFVNPPYGRQVKHWVQKCKETWQKDPKQDIILLCAARVDTRWFQELIFDSARAVCFWKGRIKFIDGMTGKQGDPSFFPSAIVYWGSDEAGFHSAFSDKGHIVTPWR